MAWIKFLIIILFLTGCESKVIVTNPLRPAFQSVFDVSKREWVQTDNISIKVGEEIKLQVGVVTKEGKKIALTPDYWRIEGDNAGIIDNNGIFKAIKQGKIKVIAQIKPWTKIYEITIINSPSIINTPEEIFPSFPLPSPTPPGVAHPIPTTPSSSSLSEKAINLLPEIPSNVKEIGVTATSIKIQWNSSARATGYNLYKDSVLIEKNFKNNIYTFKNLSPDTSYIFAVSAVNEYGESEKASLKIQTLISSSSDARYEEVISTAIFDF